MKYVFQVDSEIVNKVRRDSSNYLIESENGGAIFVLSILVPTIYTTQTKKKFLENVSWKRISTNGIKYVLKLRVSTSLLEMSISNGT